ncbi:hypothetical protein ACHWQZ_G003419 [Mnemiopsis leidyi]
MLPFTTIPFVKSKMLIKDKSSNDECLPSHNNNSCFDPEGSLNNSAQFYRSVINEPSTSYHSNTLCKSYKIKEYKQITPSSYKVLYNHVCNDVIESVKDWFSLYIPNSFEMEKNQMAETVKKLSDESGCNIAMTAVVHRSYESLIFLLTTIPELATGNDNFGNTFNDVVESIHDERVGRIVNRICHKRINKISNSRTNSQSKSYCEQCSMFHSDPDHESSISHLVAENRAIPEINPHLNPNNAGYKMMSKLGWSENKGLGPSESGRKYLIKTQLKLDRRGLGIPDKNKPKVSHFEPHDVSSLKDNLLHKRKIRLKTESKEKRRKKGEKSKQWEINFRRSMNEYD